MQPTGASRDLLTLPRAGAQPARGRALRRARRFARQHGAILIACLP